MSTLDQDKKDLKEWEDKLRIADIANKTNIRQNFPIEQKYKQLDLEIKDKNDEKKKLKMSIDRLKNEVLEKETSLRKLDNDVRQKETEFARAKRQWQDHQISVQNVQKNLDEAKWQVGNWKAKVGRSEILDRTEKAKTNNQQRVRGF
ncbi:MAG: hypothetical protein KBB88_01135 [Candidatus Pacebacteria bacterium]|nr:hypothetical protein [Candidatus Paceibacterota bacterium]